MALNVATVGSAVPGTVSVGAFSASRASASQLYQAQGVQLRKSQRDGACVCEVSESKEAVTSDVSSVSSEKRGGLRQAMAAALAAAVLGTSMDALADLNSFEANTRGEFGIGSAVQFGSADLKKTQHANENFRRGNFTSADMKEADFSGSTFNGAYLEKAVAYKTNFSGADLSDTLMDRMVSSPAK
ncbi:hypothetical protein M758_8G048200 [Ceratodon purpureus]|nr:hypothetical protein M758_8G048200 [Ceratodon purpureus]